ncbi:Putative zinc-binding metallo-peptidase [Filimonas lacunae]|uniref:Putative zinc-binding metallo-peptidase n=1 Tax=Filimonas lacunae TaxID=477680 RepID=A0A173MD74_9BACT|nr:putative zinc-binding metallopeptidase [Filimonas lacunae]BAV05542.1 hypothetical protein FLA_1549 [Filimonas lacunae]SIT20475.1 Putative zinc-binding metallo-peptidase [Filimonas lacunae]
MNYKYCLLSLLLLTASVGCRKTEAKLSAEVEPAPTFDESTELGRKRKEMFDKYGVLFEYEWNRYAFAPNVVADPAKEEDVLPYIELVDELFFKAMDTVSGPGITSVKETPVTIMLIGSGINYGGSESFGESTAGQAGNIQPNRLTLGGLSSFGQVLRAKGADADADYFTAIYDQAPSSFPADAGLVGFVYHEYTHYLDSKHQIPDGFEVPARKEYLRGSDQYKSVSLTQAIAKGFFIPYGMQNEHEDFATYVQTIIWKSQSVLNSVYLTNPATIEKYRLVTKYFDKLKIPIDKLKAYLNQQSVKDRLLLLKRKYE